MAEPAIQDFFQWVRQARVYAVLEPSGQIRKAFIPRAIVQAHFEAQDRAVLNDILSAIFSEGPPLYAENIVPKYTTVFCILIHIGKERYIPDFTRHGSLGDNSLPFDLANRPQKFPLLADDPDFFSKFCAEQWRWCAPIFQRHMLNEVFEANTILPIIFKEELGGGGSGTIYKVKIHKLYNDLRSNDAKTELSEESASTFVLKTYITEEARKYYANEVAAFRTLRRTSNIIDFYGSYIHGETFNVLLEFADKGDLEQYFREEAEPTTGADIIRFWESIFKLGKALGSIHQVKPQISSNGPPIFQGWHQDVKPENIFIVSDNAGSSYDWQFKLGDLGLSHFNREVTTGNSTASDAHGTRTYGAPECYRADDFAENSDLQVKQSVDIWSLGCVYSESARWVVGGYKGLLEYREERRAETRAIRNFRDGNCFHNGERALKAVNKSHRKTSESRRVQDCLTEQVIETMIKPMLEVDDRPTAMQVWRTSTRILDEAKERLEAWKGGQSHTPQQTQQNPPPPPVIPPSMRGYLNLHVLPTTPKEQNYVNNPDYRGEPQPLGSSPDGMSENEGESDEWLKRVDETNFNSPRKHSSNAGVLNKRRAKSKSVSFSEYSEDGGAVESQKATIGIGRSITESLTGRSNGWQSVSTGMSTGVSTGTGTNTMVSNPATSRPRPIASSSAPQDSQTQAEDIDEQRPVSAPPVSPVYRPLTPNAASPPHNEVNHQHTVSHGSSSLASQHQKKGSEDTSKSERITRAKSSVPAMSVEQALEWKKEVKSGKESPLPHGHLLDRLKKRDQVFLLDDSGSMASYWKSGEVKKVFEALSYIVKGCDPDGTELYFTIFPEYKRSRDTSDLLYLLHKGSLNGSTDIDRLLDKILENYKATLRQGPSWKTTLLTLGKEKGVRPLNLYVLTDGVWEDKSTGERAIVNLVQTLIELGKTRSQVGIQFISFGDNPVGLDRMHYLDSRLGKGREKKDWLDIVDTTPSNGNVWKMLLGAINDTFDGVDEDNVELDNNQRYSATSVLSSIPSLSSPQKADDA